MPTNFLSNKISIYLRLIRFWQPTGYILLFLPCAIGVGLYGNLWDKYGLIIFFFIGSLVMGSSGCIINDILDRNIDIHVERTKQRPIATRAVSVKEALVLFMGLNLVGLLILLQLSKEAIMIGLFAAILIVIYPLMKRISFWPQLFLGITYNLGVLIAVAHIKQEITLASFIAYIGCVFWTLYYDTIYGFMDIKDDKKIGVKSLARFLENRNYKLWLSGFALSASLCIVLSLYITEHNTLLLIIASIVSFFIVMWQITTLQINLPSNCLLRFKSNNYLGIIWALTSLI